MRVTTRVHSSKALIPNPSGVPTLRVGEGRLSPCRHRPRPRANHLRECYKRVADDGGPQGVGGIMQVQRKPYELLVRWDADGNLLAAHVRWSHVVTHDDGSKHIYPTTIEPVALTAEGNGFPIADVLNEAQSRRAALRQ